MGLRPSQWNVIIVGRWNRAILTPKGIAVRVFGLEEGRQFPIMVPLDGRSPFQVRHPDYGIVAYTDETKLYLALESPNYEDLARAMSFGVKILEKLPETPVSAVGMNLRYAAPDTIPAYGDLVKTNVADRLATAGRIVERRLVHSLEFGKGIVNLELVLGREGLKLSYNYHRPSEAVADLKEWLEMPVDKIRHMTKDLSDKAGLDLEDLTHEPDAD